MDKREKQDLDSWIEREQPDPQTYIGAELAYALTFVFMLESALKDSTAIMDTINIHVVNTGIAQSRIDSNNELLTRVDKWRKSGKIE